MTLDSPIREIKGVGLELEKKLALLGIRTVAELIDYYPRRYDDYSEVTPLAKLKPGMVSCQVTISQVRGRYVRRGLHITEAVASDKTGSVRLVWFNQPYRAPSLKPGSEYFVSGQFELSHQRFAIMNPSTELVSSFPVHTARIVPVYREIKGLKSGQIRRLLREVIPLLRALPETLPDWLVKDYNLIKRSAALEALHFPASGELLQHARRRLGFEEVFALSLASLLNKQATSQEHSLVVPFKEPVARQFVAHLPFQLTDAQRRAVWQIYLDMQKSHPMNRLLEGDVGAGKTVVAAMAAAMVLQTGDQVAVMAPTELLARQHAETLYRLLAPLGFGDQVGLLVGSLTPVQKRQTHRRIKDGSVRCLVGTQALIQERVDMHKLALVIIDEQHRFGVEQRKALMKKAGHMPHVLSMTATPIPRSLALTLYGELDITTLAAKPLGRKPIMTEICSPNSRAQLYKKIDSELDAGRQLFVICPLITETDSLKLRSVETVYKELSTKHFKHRQVGLLHGKLKPEVKTKVMQDFVEGKTQVLVSTTVIEVGVDVPNASVMLIEDAERFGLAQLHQLRGRVGRSDHQGYCYLMLSDSSAPSRRLRALESSNDGFALAELDLEIRGPGAIYGASQHGQLDLRIAKLSDSKLIAAARKAAAAFIDSKTSLLNYTELHRQVSQLRAVTNLN